MADSFTNDKIAALLQGTGDNENDWGARCNDETITPLAEAIAGYLEKDVAGNLDVTLTSSEARNALIKLTGTLTGDINVIVPAKKGCWLFWNATSGSFTATVKTAGGTGVSVPQGGKMRLWCDATNVIAADTPSEEASSAVNRLVLKSSGTGNAVAIEAVGSDANIDIRINPKGSGILMVGGSGILPPGIVAPYAGSTAPDGWLLCYGQAVSRATYAALFAVIGGTYGSGDGSTTFNLPDLRGRAVFGKDDMGGSAASRVTEAVSGITGTTLGETGGDQRTQSHTHSFSATTSSSGTHAHQLPQTYNSGGSNSIGSGGTTPFGSPASTESAGAHTHTVSGTTGASGSGGSQNMPPAIILNYIIKT